MRKSYVINIRCLHGKYSTLKSARSIQTKKYRTVEMVVRLINENGRLWNTGCKAYVLTSKSFKI